MAKDKDNKVSHGDIHEKLWAARDFEINHLWQKSIFLATFITLTFTLYFSAVNKFSPDYPSYAVTAVQSVRLIDVVPDDHSNIEKKSESADDRVHLIILNVICLFGYSFAVLWICMARGSKYIYERIEKGICKSYEQGHGFLEDSLNSDVSDEFYECLWAIGDY